MIFSTPLSFTIRGFSYDMLNVPPSGLTATIGTVILSVPFSFMFSIVGGTFNFISLPSGEMVISSAGTLCPPINIFVLSEPISEKPIFLSLGSEGSFDGPIKVMMFPPESGPVSGTTSAITGFVADAAK